MEITTLYRFYFADGKIRKENLLVSVTKSYGTTWYESKCLVTPLRLKKERLNEISERQRIMSGVFYYYTLDKDFTEKDYAKVLYDYFQRKELEYEGKILELNKLLWSVKNKTDIIARIIVE